MRQAVSIASVALAALALASCGTVQDKASQGPAAIDQARHQHRGQCDDEQRDEQGNTALLPGQLAGHGGAPAASTAAAGHGAASSTSPVIAP